MRAAWRLVRIWCTVTMRSSRRAPGHRRRTATGTAATNTAPAPVSSGNHLDDADDWRSTVNGSWFLPRD